MKIATFPRGGVHPPEAKTAPSDKINITSLPTTARLLLSQSIGAESKPIIKVGEHVERGQKIAEPGGAVSAALHSPISGTVKSIGVVSTLQGRFAAAITIVASPDDNAHDESARRESPAGRRTSDLQPNEIIQMIAEAGIVGLGGATFPTAVKLSPPPQFKAKVLLINGCECEPRLTCDDALMRCRTQEVLQGIEFLRIATKVDKAIVGIEENKPEAYEAMSREAKNFTSIEVRLLRTKYPQGSEKQLIKALTGKEVPCGALPISVGAIVQNVGTAYATYQAVALGIPLIERVVTIDGLGNYQVAIGMDVSTITEIPPASYANADVVAGGPMMGQSVVTLDAPVTKGLSGISIIQNPLPYNPSPCIRCAACVDACPMGLEPYLISTLGRLNLPEQAQPLGAMDCIECGCCSYSCPSARPILDYIKLAKMQIRKLGRQSR